MSAPDAAADQLDRALQAAAGAPACHRALRIAVHDYAGHPFQFELSRALAQRGHTVRHFFFGDDPGPKGPTRTRPGDPPGYAIEPIRLGGAYSKQRMLKRFVDDRRYGRRAAGAIAAFRPDVVLSGNTPLDPQRAIADAARQVGARFVFWVQDFYSLAMRRLLGGRWLGLGTSVAQHYVRLEGSLLASSDAIILISPDFRAHLPAALAASERVSVIRNWGPAGTITANPPGSDAWRAARGLVGRFVFLYTGTLARKHDPHLLLGLADAFADDPGVAIVVAAAGVSADVLRATQARAPRANLVLLPLQPIGEFAAALGAADVLITLLEEDAAEFSVPSKLLSYLCAGRPVLLSAPSRNLAATIVAESDGGLAVEAADRDGFVAAARRLRTDADVRAHLGRSGRAYADHHFDLARIATSFEDVLRAATDGPAVTMTSGRAP